MEVASLIVSLGVGGVVFAIAYTNQGNYSLLVDRMEADLAARLKTLRIRSPKLRTWVQLWLALILAFVALLGVGFDLFPIAILLASLFLAGPWYIIRRLAKHRRERIEDQLADAMVMFSSGVRAGLSLAQCLELLAIDCPRPIKQEFSQMVGEYQMGRPLERTLEEAKERLKSENFILFAAALLASRESGGRLNETVERIAKSVVETQRLERKVNSETAQARRSAIYMAIVPPLILVAYAWLDPNNVSLLFVTFPGQLLLATAVLLNVVAYIWAHKILSPDI